jgi:hypothetical protein
MPPFGFCVVVALRSGGVKPLLCYQILSAAKILHLLFTRQLQKLELMAS